MSSDTIQVVATDIVADNDVLSRFILHSRWIREDKTVRPDAFIPHPYPDLSVTRHRGISEEELWRCGWDVAQDVGKTLYGRADVFAQIVREIQLEPLSAPTPKNPNHVNIAGWSIGKAEQKSLAQKLAAESHYKVSP